VLLGVAGLLGLEVWAARLDYGLRVTSDTPTFVALLRDLSIAPFRPTSPYLAGGGLETSHATPYMQGLAWLWDWLVASPDASGEPFSDPVAAYRLLASVGLLITVVVLHACFLWVRHEAGSRAAWISLPVLLVLFGPAHVIWAGDLTFHGFLYASFYPQTLGLALLLYCLVAVDGELRLSRVAGASAVAAATMTVHPFTGVLLALLLSISGTARMLNGRAGWQLPSIALLVGYALARLWPSYSLDRAMTVAGLTGGMIVAVCAVAPFAVAFLRTRLPALRSRSTAQRAFGSSRLVGAYPTLFAVSGLLLVLVLAGWQIVLLRQPFPDPLVHSNRLAVYWVEDRWRWLLMFATGAVGLVGLARLARHGRVLPAFWFASCLTVGIAGAYGMPLPVWWRFLLFCQLPLALGVAAMLARSQAPWGRIVLVTFAVSVAFKAVTLFTLSGQLTYFGSPIQDSYSLGRVIAPGTPGLVATDPFTAYYIPAATGHRVLTVTKAHVGSATELAASERGYHLLHAYYMGENWWQTAQAMWSLGVRYIVVEKHTSLASPTLKDFSTGPTPLIRTEADRRLLGAYYYRNNRVGTLVYNSATYAIYRLSSRKLWPRDPASRYVVTVPSTTVTARRSTVPSGRRKPGPGSRLATTRPE
jgi:hypothetical protein